MGLAAEAGFFWGGERGRFAPKKGVTLHLQATDFQEKKIFCKLNTYCKLLLIIMHFNKYDTYSIVGIDKKTYEKGIGITYIHT